MGKVRIRHGDNEIEVDGSDAFIQAQLGAFYKRIGHQATPASGQTLKQQLLGPTAAPKSGKTPTPAEYYKTKGRADGISQILIFSKYLEEYENKSSFTQKDVNRVAADAKLSKDIHSQYFTAAVRQGLLRKQGQNYSLTLSAEEVLASMKSTK